MIKIKFILFNESFKRLRKYKLLIAKAIATVQLNPILEITPKIFFACITLVISVMNITRGNSIITKFLIEFLSAIEISKINIGKKLNMIKSIKFIRIKFLNLINALILLMNNSIFRFQ